MNGHTDSTKTAGMYFKYKQQSNKTCYKQSATVPYLLLSLWR